MEEVCAEPLTVIAETKGTLPKALISCTVRFSVLVVLIVPPARLAVAAMEWRQPV